MEPAAGSRQSPEDAPSHASAPTSGLLIADAEGRILDWSPAALRLHGYQSVEEVQRHVADFRGAFVLSTPEGEEIPYEAWPLPMLMRGKPVDNYALRIRRIDTGQEWFVNYTGLVVGEAGDAVRYVLMLQDVTQWHRADAALRDSEARLRGVVDTAVDGIITIDERGMIGSVNPAVTRIFGYEPAEMIGRNVSMLMPEPYARDHDQYLSAYLRTGQAKVIGIGREVVGRRKDGSTFPLDLAVGETYLAGRPMFTGIVRDVTERKLADLRARERQAELAHLERVQTMGHMASGLAHELNQPLGAIVNYAGACRQLAAAGRITSDDLDDVLTEIVAESTRAGEIIRRLRRFVQKQRPVPSATSPDTLVAEALRILSFELRNAGVMPRVRTASGLPDVSAETVQITQVFVNLIRNALDAMQAVPAAKRRLDITADAAVMADGRPGVEFAVTDNGPGVPAASLPRLFDAFFTTKTSGMGMGLALCRMIVEDHGGQIAARRNEDCGLRFSFTLRSEGSCHDRGV